MRVLVTGADGYIGSMLTPLLMRDGFEVVGLDTGFYRDGWLYSDWQYIDRVPQTIVKDLRNVCSQDLAGIDAVVHLAELSNDPLGENSPEITRSINHHGSVKLANLARQQGVKRFIYTSSCSVYGVGRNDFLEESSVVNPQTTYAECKVCVERDVSAMADDDFSPVILRNATAYGASPRMRFDIVLNNLAAHAYTTQRIAMTSDGTPWRPLVHVLDICKAILCALKAPRHLIHDETFNVGVNEANFRIREIAEIVAEVFPQCVLSIGTSGGDNRSYRVCFDKIRQQLPGFTCDWTVRRGAEQLLHLFKRIQLRESNFHFRAYTRLRQISYLQSTGQIDSEFFWSPLEADVVK